ncbi:MAG: chromosomal replication initiator protein DnaA [Chthoniobacterales bacterium]
MMTQQDISKALLEAIQQRVSKDGFERWFASLEVVEDDSKKQTLTLRVPNPIHKFFIESNYQALLDQATADIFDTVRKIKIECESDDECNAEPEKVVSKKKKVSSQRRTPREREAAARDAGMNPRYTFDKFVVGPNSQFAYAATLAVANAPARTYNPLFIHGASGLGKTHLLQAIGHHVLEQKKNARIVYVKSEEFTNEFVDAIQHKTTSRFKKKYRAADVLMIDDIQFFAGKASCQEEFFHTFNALHDGHKQIVLTSDRPACEIEKLEHRLVSRFEWGLTAELQIPDLETRTAILQSKAEELNVRLDQWILEFLADRICTNIRRLEGALMRVTSYRSLSNAELTKETIENLLRDILQEQAKKAVTISQIQKRVAEHFDIRLADMTSKRRPASIAFPRQIAMYLSRELTRSSLADIGDAFGGKDHGTVIHAVKLVKKRMEKEEETRHLVRSLDSQLQL